MGLRRLTLLLAILVGSFTTAYAAHPQIFCELIDKASAPAFDSVNGPTIFYEVITENFPTEQPCRVEVNSLDERVSAMEAYVNADGRVVFQDSDEAELPVVHCTYGMAKGEPLTVTVISSEDDIIASTDFVPFPLEVTDKKEHLLRITMANAEATKFRFRAEGYEPFEQLTVISHSERGKVSTKTQATAMGTLVGSLDPSVATKGTGKASLQVKGHKSKLNLKYEWGKEGLLRIGANGRHLVILGLYS